MNYYEMKKYREKRERERLKKKYIESISVCLRVVRNLMEVEIHLISILRINIKSFG